MRYVATSGAKVSQIGLGCARLNGGAGRRAGELVISAAVEAGVTHFDTAPSYGLGLSETLLGSTIGKYSHFTITTKVGFRHPNYFSALAKTAARSLLQPISRAFPKIKGNLVKVAQSGDAPRGKLNPEIIKASLEESLRRLNRDSVDFFLVHQILEEEYSDNALIQAMEVLRSDKLIGAFGASSGENRPTGLRIGTVEQFLWEYPPAAPLSGTIRFSHGLLRHFLPDLRACLHTSSGQIACRDFGFDPSDPDDHSPLLLSLALALDPEAVILISTNDHLRLTRTLTRIKWPRSTMAADNVAEVANALLVPRQ